MQSLRSAALAAMFLACSNAHADNTWVMGMGAVSCGKLLQYDRQQLEGSVLQAVTWAQGFLTAQNYASTAAGGHNLPQVDAQSIRAFLVKDCRDHPLDDVSDSTIRLWGALLSRHD